MPAYRDKKQGNRWRYRKRIRLPDGTAANISGTPDRNTKVAAEQAEREHIDRRIKEFYDEKYGGRKGEEVPTLDTWFNGRFWREWVTARKNSPSEREAKKSIYKHHLKEPLGHLRLDQIDVAVIAELRASLIEKLKPNGEPLADKTINNILAVVSKALNYAADVRIVPWAPKVGMLKVERPEIDWWEFEQYARILDAARKEEPQWYVAVLLAGDAGLRRGEIRGLRYREDVDLVAGTITVNQQIRTEIGPPKGRRRRTIPMTVRLLSAIKRLDQIRTGYVVRSLDGSYKTDSAMTSATYRVCRKAGLQESGWHRLRHTFGTHAALFGVNPWTLQAWLGHRRIDETMRYVHVASDHMRPIPTELTTITETDPARRILLMLGQRCNTVATPQGLSKKPCDVARF